MRSRLLLLTLLTLLGFTVANAQSVENVNAAVQQGGKVVITFDLKGDPEIERFNIKIYSSHNGYSRPLSGLTGDISEGFDIVPGEQKRVVWDAASELSTFNGELTFEIRADVYRFLQITKPADGKSVRRGSKVEVLWTGGRANEKVKIELLRGSNVVSDLGTVDNSGSYSWSIPKEMDKGKDYSMRFTSPSGVVKTGSFAVNARYPLLLKIAVPTAIVVGVFLLTRSDDDGPLPVPPEPN
ncbi:MAG: Ser-Thr-rich GPI-anchored membrane family protein [Cyclobacteriaceae bacterium]